jgi:hypothetical protein
LLGVDESAKRSRDAHQVILAHDVVEDAWTQQFREGRHFAEALVHGVVKE